MSATATRVIKNTGYLYAKMGITMFDLMPTKTRKHLNRIEYKTTTFVKLKHHNTQFSK